MVFEAVEFDAVERGVQRHRADVGAGQRYGIDVGIAATGHRHEEAAVVEYRAGIGAAYVCHVQHTADIAVVVEHGVVGLGVGAQLH